MNVTVINYGIGNLLSVIRGFENCNVKTILSSDPEIILSSDRVVLPGVGAFSNGMDELKKRNLIPVIKELANQKIPILGICLGMQLLLEESEEFGLTSGLGLIPGRVVPILPQISKKKESTIPHIGWNALHFNDSINNSRYKLSEYINDGDEVYFVHSFMASINYTKNCIAFCRYGGLSIPAIIAKDKIMGCQFHPEKSGEIGTKIIQSFLSL